MRRAVAGLLLGFLAALAVHARAAQASGIWLDVPFVKQTEDGCGSAAIAMLLRYWSAHGTAIASARADATAIQRELYSPKAHGIFAYDMERYLRESGFREFAVRGAWSDLRQHLQQGRPLIITLQQGKTRTPLHYVVVAGMDWQRDAAFVNDPARGKLLRVERQEFEKEWLAAGNWMLLAVPASDN